ncbi:sigma-70 family RNA polymerase sigma factor [Micromonospora sp. DT48]|uniref:sigma-70 family RNA polymerase sigma factor n=1 Tax=unclassified Micromonospora TaxID=2617518 RepID=UPI0012BCEF24|nr:sigma-70 family RNA polymerase sigma factor [Micromonospora sp. CP22]MTK02573.1 sigma-70 family RNA polymerase sigma factor [Micromonospora sp. CP22]
MDADEFETFVRDSAPVLRRYARAVTADPEQAEALLHQAYVRMATRWHRLVAEGGLLAYAKVTMVRLQVSRLRAVVRRLRSAGAAPPSAAAGEYGQADHDHLRGLLAGLPPMQRVVLVMTYLDNLDDESIAAATGRRPATVRSLRDRALGTLRAELPVTRVRAEREVAG